MQVDALANLRRGGRQKVTVEHVHVHPGAQAVVGNVTTGALGPKRRRHHAQFKSTSRSSMPLGMMRRVVPGAVVVRAATAAVGASLRKRSR
jgi:radical SAM superfamily enzyme with C-terminal helix-hairpin-helix motif